MSKKNRKDNINNGDEHGQESFETAGVLLPKISKEQYDNELDSFERIPKAFDEIDKEEIVLMGYQVFNAAIKNGKEQAALGVVKLFSDMKGITGGKKTEVTINNPVVKLQELTDEQLLEIASR